MFSCEHPLKQSRIGRSTRRVGFLTGYEPERIAFAKRVGFGSVELMAGIGTDCLPGNAGWQDKACKVRDALPSDALDLE